MIKNKCKLIVTIFVRMSADFSYKQLINLLRQKKKNQKTQENEKSCKSVNFNVCIKRAREVLKSLALFCSLLGTRLAL